MIGIYQIVCIFNGNSYIGSSINIIKRWKDHKYDLNAGRHRNLHLRKAWEKYGQNCFVFQVLELHESSKNLAESEARWLLAIQPEFNLTFEVGAPNRGKKGAESHMFGRKMPQAFRDKMSLVTKGRTPWNKGIGGTELAKQKLARPVRPGQTNGLFAWTKTNLHWTKGLARTEETKKKISDSLKGKPGPNAGKKLSESQKRAHSEFMKSRWKALRSA